MDRLILKLFLTFIVFQFCLLSQAQDTTSTVLESIDILSKKAGFKKMGLYDNEIEEDFNIRGYTQLTIFREDLTDEFWTS